jgi:hypothetical protein
MRAPSSPFLSSPPLSSPLLPSPLLVSPPRAGPSRPGRPSPSLPFLPLPSFPVPTAFHHPPARVQEPKIIDCGLGKYASAADAGQTAFTRTGAVPGTPLYMCPKYASGRVVYGVSAEIFAFGCVVAEVLTGLVQKAPTAVDPHGVVHADTIQQALPVRVYIHTYRCTSVRTRRSVRRTCACTRTRACGCRMIMIMAGWVGVRGW